MEFRILGPLEVASDDGLVEVQGAKRRALLALLLVHANRVVSRDRLIEDLWGGAPPESATATLYTYVSRLRKSLRLESLHTRPRGYVLEVEDTSLDALRFERALDDMSRLTTREPEVAAPRLDEAIGWWRGPALADFEGAAWAQPEIARLEELRLSAIEQLVEARSALGEHTALVPELEALVGAHPLRERLWYQLMLALYRCNRQSDALRAYQRVRTILAEESGLEPGLELLNLERRILDHDRMLITSALATGDSAPPHAEHGVMAAVLADARRAHDEHRWQDAIRCYRAAEKRVSLAGEDLERAAHAMLWGAPSHRGSWLDALERAEAAYAEEGDRRGAARMAIELGVRHSELLSPTVAAACVQRAAGYLAGLEECSEHGLVQWACGFGLAFGGEFKEARSVAEMALDVGRRTGDQDVQGLALVLLGHVSVAEARREEALAMLDQAAATAMSGMVTLGWTGFIYCATIRSYRGLADWGRATEWSDVAARWCERESVAAWAGPCRSKRAEITRLHGRLEEAEAEVRIACDELIAHHPLYAREAFNELGEVLLRRGDLPGAEDALGRGIELGSDGQPGLARLQLAQGKADAALRGLSRALDDTAGLQMNRLIARENRPFLLPVHVTAAIAAGDLEAARSSAAELAQLAEALGTEAPRAAIAVARGEVALAEGAHDAAASNLREGIQRWCDLEAPYEAAQARILLAAAYEAQGDTEAARLELVAARGAFAQMGASRDTQQVDDLLARSVGHDPATASRTFMFTDIVGSTKLVDILGDKAWQRLLTWHDRTLRSVFASHAGEEIKHGGDGFFVAFADAGQALACACEIQRALDRHRRDHGFAPDVRIGVHAGKATHRDGDYVGKVIHETARIVAAAQAGQILASTAAVAGGAALHKTGEHRTVKLRGLSDPTEIALVDWT